MKYLLTLLLLMMTPMANADDIPKVIQEKAKVYKLDPKLVYAIALVESNLNPNAKGRVGEIGIFQLRPEYHPVKPGDVHHNTEVAVKYLVYIRYRCYRKYGDAWFVCYNTGPNRTYILKDPKNFDYYKKVMQRYKQVQM